MTKEQEAIRNTIGEFQSLDGRGAIDGWCSGASVKEVIMGDTDNQFGHDIICNRTNGEMSVAKLRMD